MPKVPASKQFGQHLASPGRHFSLQDDTQDLPRSACNSSIGRFLCQTRVCFCRVGTSRRHSSLFIHKCEGRMPSEVDKTKATLPAVLGRRLQHATSIEAGCHARSFGELDAHMVYMNILASKMCRQGPAYPSDGMCPPLFLPSSSRWL
jgi:hypothetical protein